MAEAKRIELSTVRPLKKDKKLAEGMPTHRFNLTLSESNEKTCPEFNYSELLKSVMGFKKSDEGGGIKNGGREEGEDDDDDDGKGKKVGPSDPFGEADEAEDDKLKALAKKFEEKYAPVPGAKKAKMGRMEDYIDLGMGYDETDPFIDNTDAYDELVPSTLTTQYGGFYINSGKLDFKEVHTESSEGEVRNDEEDGDEEGEEEEDDIVDAVARRKKRQRLKEMDKDVRKKRRIMMMATKGLGGGGGDLGAGEGHNHNHHHHIHHHHHHGIPKKRGRKPLDANSYLYEGALLKPKKKQETVAILLQQRKAQQQQRHHNQQQNIPSRAGQQPNSSPRTSPAVLLSQLVAPRSGTPPTRAPQQVVPTIHLPSDVALMADLASARVAGGVQSNASINEIIESVIISSRERDSNGLEMHPVAASASLSSDSDNPIFVSATDPEMAPKLPEGLPDVLDETVKQIKVAARKSGEGKCKFFSNEVNNMLLSIEIMSRELSCSQRSMLFAHLASHLPCTKETLLKRAKKLRLDQEDVKLQDLFVRMKSEIDELMPKMEDAYKSKCLAFAKGIAKLSESSDTDDEYGEEFGFSSPDEEKADAKVPSVRRKFVWNDKIRMMLCDIVQIRMKCYEVSKARTQSPEEYLKSFLEADVKSLWPRGWVHLRELIKESRMVHAHLTFKPKKHLVLAKKIGLPTNTQIVPVSVGVQGSSKCEQPYEVSRVTAVPKVPSSVCVVVPPSLSPGVVSSRDTPPSKSTISPAQVPSSASMRNDAPISSPSVIVVPTTAQSPTRAEVTPTLTIHSPATEMPGKLSGHVFSLLDPKVLRNATSSNHASSASTAEYFLSELISGALANFPNSSTVSKHSLGRDKFHESSLFTAAMNKCSTLTKVVGSAERGGGGGHKGALAVSSDVSEPKVNFQLPKASSKAPMPSIQKPDIHGNTGGGVSILKEYDRHSSSHHRWTAAGNAQDLRNTAAKTSLSHGVVGTPTSTTSSRKTPSPLKADLYLGVAAGAVDSTSEPPNSKMSSTLPTVPYHSLYNIKEAIQRGLQGQASGSGHSVNHVPSKISRSLLVSQQQQVPSSSSGAYYSADLPLNFSTARSSSERISPSSRGITPSPHAYSSPPERSAHNQSPLSVSHAPSVRTVSLPQPSSKYVAGQRSKHEPHQDYLEGIAASVREQHLKKSNRTVEPATTTPRRAGGGARSYGARASEGGAHSQVSIPRSDALDGLIAGGTGFAKTTTGGISVPLTAMSLPNHHVPVPKVATSSLASGYSDPVHSIPQGCTDLRIRQRFTRPTPSLHSENHTTP